MRSIIRKEGVDRVLVQLGGQTPLNLAEELESTGARIIGTSVKSIFDAEDRGLFTALLKRLDLKQPKNRMAVDAAEVKHFSAEIGFPVLLRPSFVLGGRSMFIAYSEDELTEFLRQDVPMSPERPVLVDKFLEDAFEYDLDALCDGSNVYIAGIMQHIEAAGVHSGDSACVFPPYKSTDAILDEMKAATAKIAREIQVEGFINIQFAVKDEELYVLEVNPRASRTVPFLSKASGVNLVRAAVRLWQGRDLEAQGLTSGGSGEGQCISGWAVKEAVFSFDRFAQVDPLLGPEMRSTGEVIGSGASFGEAFAKAQAAVGTRLPVDGRVLVSVNENDRATILPLVRELEGLGFGIAATRGHRRIPLRRGNLRRGRPEDTRGASEYHRPYKGGAVLADCQHPSGAKLSVRGPRYPDSGGSSQDSLHHDDVGGQRGPGGDQVLEPGRDQYSAPSVGRFYQNRLKPGFSATLIPRCYCCSSTQSSRRSPPRKPR